MDRQHLDRRESRAGDGDVVKLILSRFDDLTAQIKDVRDEQDTTNTHLATLNGRTRAVEIEVGRAKLVGWVALGLVPVFGTVAAHALGVV